MSRGKAKGWVCGVGGEVSSAVKIITCELAACSLTASKCGARIENSVSSSSIYTYTHACIPNVSLFTPMFHILSR